jgi:hypothetical protein
MLPTEDLWGVWEIVKNGNNSELEMGELEFNIANLSVEKSRLL